MIDVQSLTMPQSTNHLDSLLRQGQSSSKAASPEMKKAFEDFVGQTFFSQMLSSMRSTQEKPAYFHGGHAEEVFQGQLDQVLGEKLSEKTAERFAGPMFDLFMLSRS
jgi:peptidoglycan hydrolase FlgJ